MTVTVNMLSLLPSLFFGGLEIVTVNNRANIHSESSVISRIPRSSYELENIIPNFKCKSTSVL